MNTLASYFCVGGCLQVTEKDFQFHYILSRDVTLKEMRTKSFRNHLSMHVQFI
jgi:hypothetical protein